MEFKYNTHVKPLLLGSGIFILCLLLGFWVGSVPVQVLIGFALGLILVNGVVLTAYGYQDYVKTKQAVGQASDIVQAASEHGTKDPKTKAELASIKARLVE